MTPMQMLKTAEAYTEARDDYDWFCERYRMRRELESVRDSVEGALRDLYGWGFDVNIIETKWKEWNSVDGWLSA